MLKAKSLSRVAVPPSLLDNPSPANLQSTRLAIHVSDDGSSSWVYIASGCQIYKLQIALEDSLVSEGKESLLIPVHRQVMNAFMVNRCPHRSEIQSMVLAETESTGYSILGTVDSYSHLIVSNLDTNGEAVPSGNKVIYKSILRTYLTSRAFCMPEEMSFRNIVRDVRDGFGSLSRRNFEVRLTGHHRGKSHGSVHELHDQPPVIQNSLPTELLHDVIKRLKASESTWSARKHVVACADVCRSWREMCKEIVRSPEFSEKITFPVSLKQPGSWDGTIQCLKRDKSSLTYNLYLCLSPALLVENGTFLLSAKRTRRTTWTECVPHGCR